MARPYARAAASAELAGKAGAAAKSAWKSIFPSSDCDCGSPNTTAVRAESANRARMIFVIAGFMVVSLMYVWLELAKLTGWLYHRLIGAVRNACCCWGRKQSEGRSAWTASPESSYREITKWARAPHAITAANADQ